MAYAPTARWCCDVRYPTAWTHRPYRQIRSARGPVKVPPCRDGVGGGAVMPMVVVRNWGKDGHEIRRLEVCDVIIEVGTTGSRRSWRPPARRAWPRPSPRAMPGQFCRAVMYSATAGILPTAGGSRGVLMPMAFKTYVLIACRAMPVRVVNACILTFARALLLGLLGAAPGMDCGFLVSTRWKGEHHRGLVQGCIVGALSWVVCPRNQEAGRCDSAGTWFLGSVP